jgi:TRAP-type C4-dicarboxylate transport system permease large subunit
MLTSFGTDKIVAHFVLTYLPYQTAFLLFILLLGLFLGCFIDSIASCLMLMPILTPIVNELGIDFLLFSIVFTLSFLTCTITPPVGTLLYVVCGIDGTPIVSTIKPILPYVLVMAVVVIAVIFVPPIGIWLPSFL